MKHTILIAEDDRDITELLTLYLTGAEFHVQSAADGAQALEMIRAGGISLVLADIMMPGLNGYELIRQVRTFSNLPIIILSAKALDTDKVLGLNIGADAYLTKPFNALEVVAYVKATLRRIPSGSARSSWTPRPLSCAKTAKPCRSLPPSSRSSRSSCRARAGCSPRRSCMNASAAHTTKATTTP